MKNKKLYFDILVKILRENSGKYELKDYRGTDIHCTQCYVCGKKNAQREFVMEWGEPFPIGTTCLKQVQSEL